MLVESNVGAAIDTSALRGPVSQADVRRFVRAQPELFGWSGRRVLRLLRDAWTISLAAVLLGFALVFGAFFLLLDVAVLFDPPEGVAHWVGIALSPLVLVLVFLFGRLVVDAVRGSVRPRPGPRRTLRLARFAAVNGLTYTPSILDPWREGTLFAAGSRRVARDVMTSTDGRFEIATTASPAAG